MVKYLYLPDENNMICVFEIISLLLNVNLLLRYHVSSHIFVSAEILLFIMLYVFKLDDSFHKSIYLFICTRCISSDRLDN